MLHTLSTDVSAVHSLPLSDLVELVENNDAVLGGFNVVVSFD